MKEATPTPRRIRYTISAVGVHQVGKLILAITVVVSLLPLTVLAVQGLLGSNVPSARQLLIPFLGTPVFMYLWGVLGAWIFNRVAHRLGGLELVLQEEARE